MRLLITLCLLGATAAAKYRFRKPEYRATASEASYEYVEPNDEYLPRRSRYERDGAEYDEQGNRLHPRVYSYRQDDEYETYERPQQRFRRQNQGYRFQKTSSGRPLRPVQKRKRPEERYPVAERFAPADSRNEYVFKPNQQRALRPVKEVYQQSEPAYVEADRVERIPQEKIDVATDRFYTEPVQKKVFERNAQLDQLEGESFQPAYTPYSAPKAAYDTPYAPPEQKSIEAAVAAGAANYNGETYEDPKRLQFQIHGQEGPHSYRFGYDTGIGYNRQFRYEERDQYGVLHGRYGYYDQEGKLQIVNYTADPESCFHAEGEHVPKPVY